jgi:hypothetical protein
MATRPRTPLWRSSARPRSDGRGFSGSWSVTSRNPLLHSGVTNATRSSRFDAEGVAPCRSGALAADLGGTLATTNFREYLLCVLRRRFAGSPPGRPPGHAASHHPLSLGWSADALPSTVGAASAPTAADNLIQSIQQTSTNIFSCWHAGGTGGRRHGDAIPPIRTAAGDFLKLPVGELFALAERRDTG